MNNSTFDKMKSQGWIKFGDSKKSPNDRTDEQKAWDSAILCASEYVRRRTKDDTFSMEIHEFLTFSEHLKKK